MAESAKENHFFTFRHACQGRIPLVFKELDITAPDFLGKVHHHLVLTQNERADKEGGVVLSLPQRIKQLLHPVQRKIKRFLPGLTESEATEGAADPCVAACGEIGEMIADHPIRGL